MEQVSRNNSLKIPRKIEIYEETPNTIDDMLQTRKALATANNGKFNEKSIKQKIVEEHKDLKQITKIPSNSNDLIVITVVKKLGAYVIAITEKSPKKYRGVFVNRMQNYCLDALEYLIQANFIKMDSKENKLKRENFQKQAIIKLKLLGYISMLAENCGCILRKQYNQISMQLAEGINLTIAWKKSDDQRFNKKN